MLKFPLNMVGLGPVSAPVLITKEIFSAILRGLKMCPILAGSEVLGLWDGAGPRMLMGTAEACQAKRAQHHFCKTRDFRVELFNPKLFLPGLRASSQITFYFLTLSHHFTQQIVITFTYTVHPP